MDVETKTKAISITLGLSAVLVVVFLIDVFVNGIFTPKPPEPEPPAKTGYQATTKLPDAFAEKFSIDPDIPFIILTKETYGADEQGWEIRTDANGRKVCQIKQCGYYQLAGNIANGQILIDGVSALTVAEAPAKIVLELNGLYLSGTDLTPICIEQKAGDEPAFTGVEINLVAKTTNVVWYQSADLGVSPTKVAVASAYPLTVSGTGELDIRSDYGNGINCEQDLQVKNASLWASVGETAIQVAPGATFAETTKINLISRGKGAINVTSPTGNLIFGVGNKSAEQVTCNFYTAGDAIVTANTQVTNAVVNVFTGIYSAYTDSELRAEDSGRGFVVENNLTINGGAVRVIPDRDAIVVNGSFNISAGSYQTVLMMEKLTGLNVNGTINLTGGIVILENVQPASDVEGGSIVGTGNITVNGGILVGAGAIGRNVPSSYWSQTWSLSGGTYKLRTPEENLATVRLVAQFTLAGQHKGILIAGAPGQYLLYNKSGNCVRDFTIENK